MPPTPLMHLLLASAGAAVSATKMFEGAGYSAAAYQPMLQQLPDTDTLCVAHSADGAGAAVEASRAGACSSGVVLLGAFSHQLQNVSVPVLVVAGTDDGVARISDFAVSRHRAAKLDQRDTRDVHHVVIRGASHHSFASGEPPSSIVKRSDLQPRLEHAQVHAKLAAIIGDFVGDGDGHHLVNAEVVAAQVAEPLVAALQLEGSSALGTAACESDFPTNPTCQYPKWPDHSLGPRKPAPSPLPPADCVCGSPWVSTVAAPMMAGLEASDRPTATVASKDAFHDVSDTRPFHLPHTFNECDGSDLSKPCTLNATTVTMPVLEAGNLFPNVTSPPLSALELKTKLKSRQATYESAGLPNSKDLDKSMRLCADINQAAYDWALARADPEVVKRFNATGEPFVIVDDKEAPIGVTGPTWIKKELVFSRVGTGADSRVEVQSWAFVVANTNNGEVPWYFPVGMHYCKLLSPARAMEWIYLDGLRARNRLHL